MLHFTIIIPTRNRADTLVHTLTNVLGQDYASMKVVVADNSSNSDTETIVSSIDDDRVTFLKTGPGLSMSANWERALLEVKGGWVTILGDDDALLSGALSRVNEIVARTGIDAVRSVSADYVWHGDSRYPEAYLRFLIEKESKIVSSDNAVNEVLSGVRSYNTLPMLYNGGFINSSLIQKAKKYNPVFYHSRIPDVYSAFAFSFLTESYFLLNYPLAINGASSHSGGTAFFQKDKNSTEYEPARKFNLEINLPSHPGVPTLENGVFIRSIRAHVLEAYLQAIDVFKGTTPSPDFFQRQLDLILQGIEDSELDLTEWVIEFSHLHQLKIDNLHQPNQSPAVLDQKLTIKNKIAIKIEQRMPKLFRLFKNTFLWPKIYEFEGNKKFRIQTLADAEKFVSAVISKLAR